MKITIDAVLSTNNESKNLTVEQKNSLRNFVKSLWWAEQIDMKNSLIWEFKKDPNFIKVLNSIGKNSASKDIAMVQLFLVLEGKLSHENAIDGIYWPNTQRALQQSSLYNHKTSISSTTIQNNGTEINTSSLLSFWSGIESIWWKEGNWKITKEEKQFISDYMEGKIVHNISLKGSIIAKFKNDLNFKKKLNSITSSSNKQDIALVQLFLVLEWTLKAMKEIDNLKEIDGKYGNKTRQAIQLSSLYEQRVIVQKTLNNGELPPIRSFDDYKRTIVEYNPYIKWFASVENHGSLDMNKHKSSWSAIGPYGYLRRWHITDFWKREWVFKGEKNKLKERYPNYDDFFNSLSKDPSLAFEVNYLYEKALLDNYKWDIKAAAAFNLYWYAWVRQYRAGKLSYRTGKNMTLWRYIRLVTSNSQPELAMYSPYNQSNNQLNNVA